MELNVSLRKFPVTWLRSVLKEKTLTIPVRKSIQLLSVIRSLGVTDSLDDHERSKLAIFNQLCFFQLLGGTLLPLFAFVERGQVGIVSCLLACLPASVSLIVLVLNARRKFEWAFYAYFLLYPLFICIVYLSRIDLGIELSFVLCGILSVFFLQDTGKMVFAISFSMISYFALFLVRRQSDFPPQPIDKTVYLLNEILGIVYIFYGLFLIMRENVGYQFRLLQKNRNLHAKNLEIERQQNVIAEKAILLEEQHAELQELDKLKNKLFSIISHDLKAPMFALRNLFQQLAAQGMSAKELEEMIPCIVNDLNYSTALVENLLEWAKSQMESAGVNPRHLELNRIIDETVELLMPQIRNKQITLVRRVDSALYAFADENMVRLVIRNILSNAIKFTPEKGEIVVGANDMFTSVEVYIKDSGKGISREEMQKINKSIFYSTHGTKNESGTGLGLMLCKEFLHKNESRLLIESEPGAGSTFSFALKTSWSDE